MRDEYGTPNSKTKRRSFQSPVSNSIDSFKSGSSSHSPAKHDAITLTRKQQGAFKIAMVVLFYFVSSLAAVFINKFLFANIPLDTPIFITWIQIFFSFCAYCAFGLLNQQNVFY